MTMIQMELEKLRNRSAVLAIFSICAFGILFDIWYIPLVTFVYSLFTLYGSMHARRYDKLNSLAWLSNLIYYSSLWLLLFQATGGVIFCLHTVKSSGKTGAMIARYLFGGIAWILMMNATHATHEVASEFLEQMDEFGDDDDMDKSLLKEAHLGDDGDSV